MAIAPFIGWVTVMAPGYFSWHTTNGAPGDLGSATVDIPAGTTVHFDCGTTGTVTFAVTGDLTLNSTTISSLSDVTYLCEWQGISGDGVPEDSLIASVGASSLTIVNGGCDEDTNTWPKTVGATASRNGVVLTIDDTCPVGTLAAIVSGDEGVTIVDTNADGTGNVNQHGDGTVMANLTGEAEAGFAVAFADSGSFTVTTSFTTDDPNYDDVTLSPVVNVVVT